MAIVKPSFFLVSYLAPEFDLDLFQGFRRLGSEHQDVAWSRNDKMKDSDGKNLPRHV